MNSFELCLKLLDDLDAHQRAAISRRLNVINEEALLTARDKRCASECKKLCDIILDRIGINVYSKSRKPNVVDAKRYVCKKLRDMGFTYDSIAKALNIHHTTAIFHYNKALDSEDYPRQFPEYHYIKSKVESEE